jgi:hypothetical protein
MMAPGPDEERIMEPDESPVVGGQRDRAEEEWMKKPRDIWIDIDIHARRAQHQHYRSKAEVRANTTVTKAYGALVEAVRRGEGFARVCALADLALEAVPGEARALALRAVAKAQLGLFDGAISDAEQSLALDPDAGKGYDISLVDLIPLWRRGVKNFG